MNVLISSVSRKVSLVRAFQDALRTSGGGNVIAVDCSPLSPALYQADVQCLVPRSTDSDFLEKLLRLCQVEKVDLVVPTRDEELSLFARHRQTFLDQGIRVMVADPDTVETCLDKFRFAEFCRVHGFPTPRTYRPEELTDEAIFPVFVKPRFGKGGKATSLVRSREELEFLCDAAGEMLIQEAVDAPEYTIDLFADFQGTVISAVPRQRMYVFGGESFITRTCRNQRLIDSAVGLSEALGLVGHNTIQCFLQQQTVHLIEVNPRYGGAAHLGFAAGAPTPLFLVKLLKGEMVEPQVGKFKDELTMLRYTEDLFLEPEALATRSCS